MKQKWPKPLIQSAGVYVVDGSVSYLIDDGTQRGFLGMWWQDLPDLPNIFKSSLTEGAYGTGSYTLLTTPVSRTGRVLTTNLTLNTKGNPFG